MNATQSAVPAAVVAALSAATDADATLKPVIPVLGDAPATFAAYKVEEQISFVRAYDPKVQAIPGMRHAVIRYRNTDGTVKKQAQMVTCPVIVLGDAIKAALSEKEQSVFLQVLEDAEDKIIRGFIDEPTKASTVSWSVLGQSKAIDFLTAERVSQRLTKEQIENWATVAIKQWCDTRALAICESKQVTDAATIEKQKAGTFNAYRSNLMKLAAPVPNLAQHEAEAMQNMLKAAKLDDDMAKVLLAKLHQILNPAVTENNDL